MLRRSSAVFERLRPDWVLVYGDTNSTVAAALAAVKLHLPVAHLEAGLRSFNRRMPEEHNRVLTDHAADLLLAPTARRCEHLAQRRARRPHRAGRRRHDRRALLVRDRVLADGRCRVRSGLDGRRVLPVATIHRPDNTDDPERLRSIVEALAGLDRPVLLLPIPGCDRSPPHTGSGSIRVRCASTTPSRTPSS